jgi:hypothetical protein
VGKKIKFILSGISTEDCTMVGSALSDNGWRVNAVQIALARGWVFALHLTCCYLLFFLKFLCGGVYFFSFIISKLETK